MDAFAQRRTWERAVRLGITQLLCLGRHTISNLICTAGRQFRDWSADYRLFSEGRWQAQELFLPVFRGVIQRLPAGAAVVASLDDTLLRKTGLKAKGVAYRRDPLSPRFHCNFIRAQRFQQTSLALYQNHPGPARCIPVAYEHAPSVPRPGAHATDEQKKQYRHQCRQDNLSTRGLAMLKRLREQLDGMPGRRSQPLVAVVDGSYTNRTVLRGLPPRTRLIGRVRKNIKLSHPPLPGSTRRYGLPAPTPEQLRTDESVPWRSVRAHAAGRMHEFRIKVLDHVLWRDVTGTTALRLVVIAPLGYRLRRGSKLLYRQPAFLIDTAPEADLADGVQYYLWRWGIEVNHRDEKQLVGVGQAQVVNDQSVDRQPPFAVASYAMLLLAAVDTFGVDAVEGLMPPAKWRHAPSDPSKVSPQRLIDELRKEAWSDALDRLIGEGFAIETPPVANGPELAWSLPSAVLYGATG